MTTARYAAAAAALSDGRVLVAGGIDGSGNATASAEVYDPSTNAWTAVAPMANARAFATAAPLSNDRVLVAGGDVGGAPSASAEIYDGNSGTWSPAAPMEYPRAQPTATTLSDGTVWVIGGADLYPSEIYDPVANSWSASEWFPSLSGAVAAPLTGDTVLMAGGYEVDTLSLWPYWGTSSPSNNAGLSGYGMSAPPYMASAAPVANGDVLMAGGSQSELNPSGTTSAEIYYPQLGNSTASWLTVAPMTTPRYGAVAAPLPGGDVLVAGGEGTSGALAGAEEFTPPTLTATTPLIQDETWPSSGSIHVGDYLEVNSGSLPGYFPGETESLQWQRCFSTCQDVAQPEIPAFFYPVTTADIGATIQLVETITNAGQTATAVSNALGPVPAPGYHLEPGSLEAMSPYVSSGRSSSVQLPVVRDNATGAGEVSYRVWDPTGAGYPSFTPVSGALIFVPGQSSSTIVVPMNVGGAPVLPASLSVQLYDGSPIPVVAPSEETLTIRDPNSSLYVRDPANPLGLSVTPPAGNPLGDAQFYSDSSHTLPGRASLAFAASDPPLAASFAVIAREPNTERFGAWNGLDPAYGVSNYLDRAASAPGTVPLLSTYRLVDGHCGHYADPPADQVAYHDWITGLAQGIGYHPAVLFLEMDSLITTGCLSPEGVAVRMNELRDAIHVLSNDPHLVVYLDAGAADALPAKRAASLLLRAGVAKIQGFFLNSTHFDWTKKEIAYGEKISRLTGGKHFVINTAENGRGPLRPRNPAKQGNEVLCDPPGRGLGPLPTASTSYPKVDAFAWIANPGVSGGECRPGAPPSGVFWPALAVELVQHEDFQVR